MDVLVGNGIGNQQLSSLNAAQACWLRLIALSVGLGTRGDEIFADLGAHRDCWIAAIAGDRDYPLLGLRDLGQGFWNADTLWVLTTDARRDALETLAWKWGPHTVRWLDDAEDLRRLGGLARGLAVLELWWP
jgi:hypothetical protein